MLVNAAQFPGPALWQGIMLIALLPVLVALFHPRTTLKLIKITLICYVIFGIVLAVLIVRAYP